ncbi:dynein axonemal heavy chain 3-like [Dendrobates tinctorius]|uniref:dynein axonemal heavy chain 3-like n=1 Tax=Dendrobates tinctorius TaxID=92724 RepID=UPI003CCA6C0D
MVAPFLRGDALKAYFDLSQEDAQDYAKLKGASVVDSLSRGFDSESQEMCGRAQGIPVVSNEKPKILQHGAFTQAVPFKEEKFHRHVSDSIANNYSPAARDVSTHSVYKLSNINEHSELCRQENPTGLLCHKPPYQDLRIVKKKNALHKMSKRKAPGSRNEDHCEFFSNAATRGTERQSENSVSSNCMPAFDVGLRNSEPLPPIQKQINTKEKRHPSIQCTDTLRHKNRGCCHYKSTNEPVWIADCSKYLSPHRSLPLLSTSSDNAESFGLHRPLSLAPDKASHSFSTPATEQHRGPEGTKHTTQPETHSVSTNSHKKRKNTHHDVEDWREHDAATKEALCVLFPPPTFSTHGLSRPASPTEEHLQRYYRLIEESIDPCMVSPLSVKWLQGIYSYIPAELCKVWGKSLQDLTKEAEENYTYAIKKSMLDYILLDSLEQQRLGIEIIPKMSNSAGWDRFPWHKSVNVARVKLMKSLHITRPVMTKILLHFHRNYVTFSLVDVEILLKSVPISMNKLVILINSLVQKRAKLLQETWIKECCDIVGQNRDDIESIMPEDEDLRRKKMDHLFCSLSTLMSNLQRHIVETSLTDLVEMIETYSEGNHYEGNHPSDSLWYPVKPHLAFLFMKPFLKESDVSFNPSVQEIVCGFDNVVESLVISVQQMPRIENFLFQAVDNLKIKYISSVQIHEEIVLSAKARIKAVIENNMHGPNRYSLVYKPFLHLLSPLTERRLKILAQKDVGLKVFARELDNMKKLASDVALLPVYVPMKMLLMDCSEINQWMIDRTRQLTNIIINKVAATSEKFNRKICQQYDDIVTKITAIAESTATLVELQDYILKLRTVELLSIKDKLAVAAENLLFLMDHASLSKEDIILNGNTFSWPQRIIPIISGSVTRLQREHDGALARLAQWQKDFTKRLADVIIEVKDFQKKERMSEAGTYVQKLSTINRRIQEFMEEVARINKEEELLGIEQMGTYSQISEICKLKEPYETLWTTALHFSTCYDKWMNGPLQQVNAEEVEEEVQNLWKTSYKLTKAFYHPDLYGPLKVATTIKTKLEKFKINMPLVTALCTPGIKPRHWDLMCEKVGFNITPHEGTSLLEILHLGLQKYLDDLNQISLQASKEYALEKALNKMKTDWEEVCFVFSPYKDGDSHVLAAVDEIQVLFEDHIVKTTTMKGSPFITPFEKEILTWESKLRLFQEILESWLRVQMAWLYLEPVFGSEDIRSQIPVEGNKFEIVDRNWRLIMRESVKEVNAMSVISQPQMLDKLKEAELLLDDIQKGLNDYLERKRLFFPRFFFLSNDELLEILSETKDPLRVQPHLKKCFEGIAKLTFNVKKEITHMESLENEKVELVTRIIPSNANGLVEKWLHEVERIMKLSLHEVMNHSIKAYTKSQRKEWVLHWPGQVVLASSMVHWTTEVSKALVGSKGLQRILKRCSDQIEDIVNLVRGRLTKMERITLGALITIDVHARDVVSSLNKCGITNISDFSWIAQMRYYWEKDNVVVKMVTTSVPYGYEYLGNSSRLVLTPLTDRCFRTLMGALQLNLGGAPEGPAGTGKTETCKDLARAVAKQCVVFNCSDGLDYKAMGKFFKGLAQSGAWACFDEFNRIELEVLSVVAQQIQTIQRAISEQVQTFMFEGTEISLDSSCTVFITMNPGYAGRAELPDNLKVLFRTVAMMVPDYALIAEISLYSMGFVAAHNLSTKIVATYRLCSEQLSSQHHYDYGMRAVKSVLTAAGNLKVKLPNEKEDILMLRSIRDVNLPKFLSHDVPLFDSIISDLFPGVILPAPDHGSLEVSIREITKKMNLQLVPCFIKKIIQIYEMMLVRHGFMLIGSPLGGKTSALKVLAAVLKDLEANRLMDEHGVDYIFINPKAITIGQLYGSFDPVSHEWIDGVLASVFRSHAACNTKCRKWCIFDGPVDAVWVENMNTVLDDNKKLCLMSGEIIQMSPQQNMIFEVLDLEQASPSTVSRCGMIYMEGKDLGWEPLTESWITAKLPSLLTAEESQIVQMMCRWLIPVCLEFVEKNCTFVIPTSPMHLTMSMLKIYECLLKNVSSAKEKKENEDGILEDSEDSESPSFYTISKKAKEDVKHMIMAYGLFSVIWSVGGILNLDSKQRFSEFLKDLCDQAFYSRNVSGLQIPKSFLLPKEESIYDVVYMKNTFSSWCMWKDLVTPPKIEDLVKHGLKNCIIDDRHLAGAQPSEHNLLTKKAGAKIDLDVNQLLNHLVWPLPLGQKFAFNSRDQHEHPIPRAKLTQPRGSVVDPHLGFLCLKEALLNNRHHPCDPDLHLVHMLIDALGAQRGLSPGTMSTEPPEEQQLLDASSDTGHQQQPQKSPQKHHKKETKEQSQRHSSSLSESQRSKESRGAGVPKDKHIWGPRLIRYPSSVWWGKKCTQKANHKICPLCKEELPTAWEKRLCESCIEHTICKESPGFASDLRALIAHQVENTFKTLQGKSKKHKKPKRKEPESDPSDRESESSSLDTDSPSSGSSSSADEGRSCFPIEETDILIKAIRTTMGLVVTRPKRTILDAICSGLEQKKRRSFTMNDKIQALIQKEWKRPEKEKILNDIIVSTPGTAMQMYFLETLLLQDKPLLFVGPTGTGKTAITNSFLRHLPQEKYVVCLINFSVQVSANQTQDIFLTKLERRKKRVYGAPLGKQAFVFVDDLNMPAKEKYGAQPPIELLRQWIDHGYWFDRKDTNMITIENTSIVAAMEPPAGGRHGVTPRLLRHFNVLSIETFNDETMKSIFQPVVDWHFNCGFDTSLKRYSRILVWATMDLYRQVALAFLPMPSKSHYVFSLRDFSRVIQGIILLKPSQVHQSAEGAQKLMRLWIHEVYRVFCDRLVSSLDRQKFFHIVKNVVQSQFKEKMTHLFTHLVIGREIQDLDMRNLFFGDYIISKNDEKSERVYNEIMDIERLKTCMEDFLHQYNKQSKTPMNLVMFHFAIEHISRISRILKMPGGHALLIGIGGTGRQSATRLAAFMVDIEVYQVSILKSYTVSEWRDDLKTVLRAAGQNGIPTVFLFADHQIKDESFLEDINMILSTGDVPSLFNNEEKLEVMEKMCQLFPAHQTQSEITPSDFYNKFKDQVRRNLHVVLAFSPTGEAFRDHLRHYSSLVNCCTIDWFQAWPEDALEKVANHFLDDVEMSQEIRNEAVFMCQHFHQSVVALSERVFQVLQRQIYVTSTSYLELIKTFKNLLERKRLELLTSKNRYLVGLEKLDFASSQITIMQQELTELKPMLIERSGETEELVNIIADETLEVEAVKSLVEADEATANKAALEAKAIKEECEQQLSVAIPALNSAIAALDTLKASDITLLKTMQNPPSGVRLTLAAICILKGIKPEKRTDPSGKIIDDFWPSSKKMLGDMKFLDSLKEFEKDNIPSKVTAQIRRDFISNPEFQPAVIKNVSSACEGLCSWVRAIEVYDKVAKIVAPKRQRLETAEADLKVHMDKLKIKRIELKEVTAKLKDLQDRLSQKLSEKRILEENINMTKLKLNRAEKLINGLGGEKQRWRGVAIQLEDTYQNIVGDMLLSAGIVAYLGPFTAEFRQDILKCWFNMCQDKNIPVSNGFAISGTLGDPVKIMEWQFHGLPKDNFSLENAIIVTSAQRWPLVIDPQGQANKWIKNMEKINKIQICKVTDADYLRTVGNSIQFGTPVLIENITEELDPILEPVLLRQTFKQDGVEYIRLGESVIHYSRDFKLYMTTRLRNPHYLPEVSVKVTLINFMITPVGLEDQLLTILAAEEKPDLEERKNLLYLEGARTRKQLKEIEDQILEVLSLTQGNILEDERAIDILSSSKKLSQEVQEKQEITAKTEKQIDETRDGYRPVANHSSAIFFVISDLAYIDSMYQYSLAWFINLYVNAIKKSETSPNLQERTQKLNDYFTHSIYEHVCRSLFEKHKLLFSVLLCVGLQRNKALISNDEWHFLLTGGVALEIPHPNPAPVWLKDKSWGELLRLSTLPFFKGLDDHFCSNLTDWKNIYDSSHPNEMELPDPWEDLLTAFQKLLVIRCLRPDKVIPTIQQFIIEKMGPAYVDPPTFDLHRSYMDSTSSTPLIFVLSSGADPLELLMKFAEEQEMGGIHLQTISLGQGQGPIARKMIKKAAEEGTWVVLQNCHLALSWLTDLEHICEEVITEKEKTKSSFRLWLTSYPSQNFPISVLQNGIKMTNESPKGLRANLLKSYLSDPICNPSFFNGCNKPQVFKKLLFGLCFFHALVQERRTYGSLGWNIPYEFSDSDLKISAKQLQKFLNDYEEAPLDAIVYLTGECNYGGRVTDEHDRRLLLSLLDIFLCEAVITEDHYTFSPSGKYFIPKYGTHDSYTEYIKSLPLNADPEVFGLHMNGNITREQKETVELFDGILTTLPKQTSGGGKSTSEVVQELTVDILSKLPEDFNVEEVKRMYPIQYTESMNTVLVHELLRFNRLTSTIRMSLQDLNKAIAGLSVMSNELDDLFNSMIVGKVPSMWSARSYPSLKPLGGYMTDLLQRLNFFKEWIQKGTPKVFWISGFFFTQSFLTGALQNYARKHKTPIDLLGFQIQITDHSYMDDIDTSPADGIYINGLYMEGARWDRDKHMIGESFAKVLYDSMPIIWLIPEEKVSPMDSFYQCPVYKTSVRHGELSTTGHSTNYVLTIALATDKPPSQWTNRGVACLCQLDY